jgi:Tol biopolymer transport system component
MAPEQLEGKEADARTDIFAFGVVVYEMTTGKKAFEGKSQASVISAIMSSDPQPMSSLQPMTPPALNRAVKRCLAKEPDERCQSAKDLTDELKWIAEGGSQTGTPAPTVARHKGRERLLAAVAAFAVAAALTLAFLYFRHVPAEQTSTKLSVLPPATAVISSDSAPAISPDGHRLAFVARDTSGGSLLWVRPLDSLAAEPLAGTEEAREPFWSPDSRFLGFFSQGKLKKVDASGGPPQTLCDLSPTGMISPTSVFGSSWSSDGVIAFGGNLTPIEAVPAAGGQPKPATAIDRSRLERSHIFPDFLPDGHHFLYLALSAKPENTGIYVGSLDSRESKRLLGVQSEVKYAPPGYLLFVRNGTLVAQPFDASRLELSGEPLPIAEHVVYDPIFGDTMVSVSGNGVLAYRGGAASRDTQLVWFDRTGKQLGPAGPPGDYLDPELSPDGKRVAFDRKGAQGHREIWLLELAGGTATRFTFNPSDEYFPIWSPDGSQIVFASNREGSFGFYQKPSSGAGNEESLLRSATDTAPYSWSLDGRFIVYRSINTKGINEVWVLPLFGDRKAFPFLQSEQINQLLPKLSPDGHWLAYVSNESGRFEVYVQSFPKARGKWQISNSGGIHPRWARDGKELFYFALDGKLTTVPVKGDSALEVGPPKALFDPYMLGGARTMLGFRHQYDVSPDGQRFLINVPVAEESSSPITLVLNWTAGLKK